MSRFDEFTQFEEFDPRQGGDELAAADVAEASADQVDAADEATIETLGALSDSQDEIATLLDTRRELEEMLMAPAGAASDVSAAADEAEPYTPTNVVGVGIGEKLTRGVPTGRLAVKVLVKEKLPQNGVQEGLRVPRRRNGVVTDVEESGEIHAQSFTARRRPAPCGVSIGNCTSVMAGTLGCLVTRGGQLFILSNNHVIALVNTSPLGAGIPQPGRLDGGVCQQDVIAQLTQRVVINFAPGATNLVDAAIARTSPALVDPRILRPGGVLQRIVPGAVPPVFNLAVQKSGRTTQHRRGVVDLVATTVDVSYAPLGGVARFTNQFRVRGAAGAIFSDRGDSGSLVTSFPGNRPVGLLFAGNAAANMTFCNPISTVLSAFGVSIVV